ncbi:MAG TPA: hypothetical protein VGA69_07315 [Nitriliruptorales bacterium]
MARRSTATWAHRYPPLAGLLLAGLLAAFVLPSALNVPQSAPTQTLEFAPVPPEDDQPPPPGTSNLETLSLGSSDTTPPGQAGDGGGDGPGLPPPPEVPEGSGTQPVTKRCVGDPPRQTEDKLSPPCVAHFDGDNGGATAPGVTGDEIVVLAVEDSGFIEVTSRGTERRPVDVCFDIDAEPTGDWHLLTYALRAYSNFFNSRYQTYGRHVHFHQCWTNRDSEPTTPETARAEMNEWIDRYEPLATMMYPIAYEEDYIREASRNGVVTFKSSTRLEEFYRRAPGLVWSYTASIEIRAKLFADHICTKVLPHPVSFSGNGDHGQPRELGLLYTNADGASQAHAFADQVRTSVEACGGRFEDAGTVPQPFVVGPGNRSAAQNNMARFQASGVTTVIWAMGFDSESSKVAAEQDYYPEWVVAGDARLDGWQASQEQDQDAWRHAWAISPTVLSPAIDQTPCYQAVSEGDPGMNEQDRRLVCTNFWYEYNDYRQLFTGIQVAGPRLTVANVDKGLHAIPAAPSDDPTVPACFYEPGDYTCVKDGVAMWWDPDTPPPGQSNPGCYRMTEAGKRYFAGTWPEGDVLAQRGPDDPCTSYAGVYTVSLEGSENVIPPL